MMGKRMKKKFFFFLILFSLPRDDENLFMKKKKEAKAIAVGVAFIAKNAYNCNRGTILCYSTNIFVESTFLDV